MRFVDEVVVDAKAGDGGNGIVAWRRESHVPRGGPAGGDGGDGGDIIFVADRGINSLLDFHFMPVLKAQDGEKGGSSNMYGKAGEDKVFKLPVGTQVIDENTDELIADLAVDGMQAVVCKGGKGGLGNSHFTSPTRQAPHIAKAGIPGEARTLRLSLKLLADVGLVGLPNAGKSTLLSRLSAARPKIADYPFTTLSPMLGVVRVRDENSFVMADIPGLIEGASDGVGLGTRFLKHIERVRLICHLIEPELDSKDSDALLKKYLVIRNELKTFSEDLDQKPELVVVTKKELFSDDLQAQITSLTDYLKRNGVSIMTISAVAGEGLDELLDALWQGVSAVQA